MKVKAYSSLGLYCLGSDYQGANTLDLVLDLLFLVLNSVRRATDRRLRSGGFCGEVKVLLSKGIQGFQPVEEGQCRSVLTGLVDTYVHDLLVHVDV